MSILNYILDLNNPIIYKNTTDADIMSEVFTRFSKPFEVQSPPVSADFSSLDNLLGGRDMIVIGGPMVNSIALGIQSNLANFQTELTAAGVQSLSFSTGAAIGDAFGSGAPSLTFTNSNGTFSYVRSEDSINQIADYAVIVMLRGTTHRLLYIAGVRDFGTAIAMFILDWATRDNSTWPSNYGNVSTLTDWKTALGSTNSIIVEFNVDFKQNSNNVVQYVNDLYAYGVRDDLVRAIESRSILKSFFEISEPVDKTVRIPSIVCPTSVQFGSGPHSVQMVVRNTNSAGQKNPSLRVVAVQLTFEHDSVDVSDNYEVTLPPDFLNSVIAGGEKAVYTFTVMVKDVSHNPTSGFIRLVGGITLLDESSVAYSGVSSSNLDGWFCTGVPIQAQGFVTTVDGVSVVNSPRDVCSGASVGFTVRLDNTSSTPLSDVGAISIGFSNSGIFDSHYSVSFTEPFSIAAGHTGELHFTVDVLPDASLGFVQMSCSVSFQVPGSPASVYDISFTDPVLKIVSSRLSVLATGLPPSLFAGQIVPFSLVMSNSTNSECRSLSYSWSCTDHRASDISRFVSSVATSPNLVIPAHSLGVGNGYMRISPSCPSDNQCTLFLHISGITGAEQQISIDPQFPLSILPPLQVALQATWTVQGGEFPFVRCVVVVTNSDSSILPNILINEISITASSNGQPLALGDAMIIPGSGAPSAPPFTSSGVSCSLEYRFARPNGIASFTPTTAVSCIASRPGATQVHFRLSNAAEPVVF